MRRILAVASVLVVFVWGVRIEPSRAAEAGMADAPAAAVKRVAVLDFRDGSDGALKQQEVLYLSDLVRGVASEVLPRERFPVITRENIQEILPPGKTLTDCLDECAVETGRKLGVTYVVTGDVTVYGGELRATVNMHETGKGDLLGSVRAGGPDAKQLENDLHAKAVDLLSRLRVGVDGAASSAVTEGVLGGGAQAWSANGPAKVVVAFASDPSGALVEIDGQPVGETPCSRALVTGVYRVGVKKVRYVASEQSLEVQVGTRPTVTVKLTPDFGWLTVETDPAGLPVTIDGEAAGAAPITAREIGPGPHDIMVDEPRYHAEGRRVVIDRGERETVRVAPVPRNGGITVIATDQDGNALAANVYEDGALLGRAHQPITLLAGKHHLTVEYSGATWRGEVAVEETSMSEMPAVLPVRPAGASAGHSASRGDVGDVEAGSMQMVSIQPGAFMMGSLADNRSRSIDDIQHRVQFQKGYLIGSTEVTQALYLSVMGTNPSNLVGASRPVEQLGWMSAIEFCNALSRREGLKEAYRIQGDYVAWDMEADGYRLPTEAEWEYACRAGASDLSGKQADGAVSVEAAWSAKNSKGTTHDVGLKDANAWGLYDMLGNVWEWCWDWYGPYSLVPVTYPRGPERGTGRVLRGGSWASAADRCNPSVRDYYIPEFAMNTLGFRVARNTVKQ